MSTSLKEFTEMINDISDENLLDVAEGLLKDIVEIENLKERAKMLEDNLHKGERAAFWFLAMGLDRDEVDLATNTVTGRRRFLKDKEAREQARKEIEEAENSSEESCKEDSCEDSGCKSGG